MGAHGGQSRSTPAVLPVLAGLEGAVGRRRAQGLAPCAGTAGDAGAGGVCRADRG
ncbi:PTPA-CTERM sorting domain-containing protein [Streptomyces fagopyri]|uniref:PTPA-CTERM sorting domain-containing protein n=1 Tax=Streptomyces fagopyri TaxID=2662397 RepID=UPI003674809D